MKNKIVTHFYVKEAKKDSNGEAPIYLRITVNGERAEISTNRRINPEIWDKSSERVAGRSEPARIINSSLNNILGKVEKHFSGFDVKDERISAYTVTAKTKFNIFTLYRKKVKFRCGNLSFFIYHCIKVVFYCNYFKYN